MEIPCNRFGTQEHRDQINGQRYAGLWFAAGTDELNTLLTSPTLPISTPSSVSPRGYYMAVEGMKNRLTTPVKEGHDYEVSVSASLAERGEFSELTRDESAYYKIKLFNAPEISSPIPLPIDPRDFTPSSGAELCSEPILVTNETDWTDTVFRFTAPGDFDYLVIERAYPDNIQTQVLTKTPAGSIGYESYLYFDDISLVEVCPFENPNLPHAPYCQEPFGGLVPNDNLNASAGLISDDGFEKQDLDGRSERDLTKLQKFAKFVDLGFQIVPNPNNGHMILQYNFGSKQDVRFEIVDVFGKILYKTTLKEEQDKVELNLPNLADGMYYYRVLNKNQIYYSGKVEILR